MKKIIGLLLIGGMALAAGDEKQMAAESTLCSLDRNYAEVLDTTAKMSKEADKMPNGAEVKATMESTKAQAKAELDKMLAAYKTRFKKPFDLASCKTKENFENAKKVQAGGGSDVSKAVAVGSRQEVLVAACEMNGNIAQSEEMLKTGKFPPGWDAPKMKKDLEKAKVTFAELQRGYQARHHETLDLAKCPKK